MKKLLWLVVFQSVALLSISQTRVLDSLTDELGRNPQENLRRVDLLNELSLRILKNQPEKSLHYAQEALALSQRMGFAKEEALAMNNLAVYYLVKSKAETALKFVIDALQIGEREQSSELQAEACSILGTIYFNQKSNTKALQFLRKALTLKPNNSVVSSRIFNSLGSIARENKSYDSALMYYEEAIRIMNASKDGHCMPEVLNNIGTVYLRQGKIDVALSYFKKCADVAEIAGNRRAQILSYVNIGNVLIEQKKYLVAEEIETKALMMAKAMDDIGKIGQIYLSLATIKMETGKFHEAHLLMTNHYALRDSLLNAEKNRQIAEIETKYETEKKDQTILALQQEGEIQKLKQLYWFGSSLCLIVAFGVFYFLQRMHHKKVVGLLATQKVLNQKLQENDLLKSKFFANISHEFRTPLSLILAPIEEKLSAPNLGIRDKESFFLIKRNANRLLILINQLLDLTKLEARKMELKIRQDDLKKFLRIVAASFDSFAETRSVRFEKIINFDLQETWYDADKLEKIIYNILFNAFKFTSAGGTVTLAISQATKNNDLEIKITDTGRGIPEHEQPYLFSPFYQSRYDGDESQSGTGLGLALVKELVNLYQGNITLTSSIHKGTTITIILPVSLERLSEFAIVEEIEVNTNFSLDGNATRKILSFQNTVDEMESIEDGSENNSPAGLDTILIVEDNDDMRNFISTSLRNQFTTLTAKNGEEGYGIAIERIPDLIISDVMMPVLDGIRFSEKIKNDERTSHIPIVLLTAKADKDSRIEGLQKGVDDYLAKPFSMDELCVRITNLIEQRKKLAVKYKKALASLPVERKEFTLDEKFLLKVSKVVEDNIADSRFGVGQLAEEINLSRAQLFRKLKAITGTSPNEFINEIRLQKAAKLILSKSDTLAQIGYSVGFNEQSYFAKCFRKRFGVSPSEYGNKVNVQEVLAKE